MKINIAKARARTGSRYPKPFDEPCKSKTRRRLGHAAGLTQFGVNLLELGPGAWSNRRRAASPASDTTSSVRLAGSGIGSSSANARWRGPDWLFVESAGGRRIRTSSTRTP